MNRKSSIYLRAICFALLSSISLGMDDEQNESEIDCAAVGEPYQLVSGMHTVNASISPASDIDTFQFQGTAGEQISVVVNGTTDDFDVRMELFAPVAGSLGVTSCNAPPSSTCSDGVLQLLAETGLYSILISDVGADDSGDYTLQLQRLPAGNGPILPYSLTAVDRITPSTDSDFFSFYGAMGSTVRFQLSGNTNDFDPVIAVANSAGVVLAFDFCLASQSMTCSISNLDLALSADDFYEVRVSDVSFDDAGSYDLTMTCIAGCPTIASSTFRNGSGSNPAVYSVTRPAVPGGCWVASIDASSHPGAAFGVVYLYGASHPGLPSSFGEILVNLGSGRIGKVMAPVVSGTCSLAAPVSNDLALVGLSAASQGLILGGGAQLTNAIDYVIGH